MQTGKAHSLLYQEDIVKQEVGRMPCVVFFDSSLFESFWSLCLLIVFQFRVISLYLLVQARAFNDTYLVSSSLDHTVSVWNAEDTKLHCHLKGEGANSYP